LLVLFQNSCQTSTAFIIKIWIIRVRTLQSYYHEQTPSEGAGRAQENQSKLKISPLQSRRVRARHRLTFLKLTLQRGRSYVFSGIPNVKSIPFKGFTISILMRPVSPQRPKRTQGFYLINFTFRPCLNNCCNVGNMEVRAHSQNQLRIF
jgi:hypothetical protein